MLGRLRHRAAKPEGNGDKSGRVVAVNDVSLDVRTKEIFGILGPNGSGKSTLIRLMTTLLVPDEGQIQVFGLDVTRYEMEVKRLINRVSVEAAFFKKLSSVENLLYAGRLYGLSGQEARRQTFDILHRLVNCSKVERTEKDQAMFLAWLKKTYATPADVHRAWALYPARIPAYVGSWDDAMKLAKKVEDGGEGVVLATTDLRHEAFGAVRDLRRCRTGDRWPLRARAPSPVGWEWT